MYSQQLGNNPGFREYRHFDLEIVLHCVSLTRSAYSAVCRRLRSGSKLLLKTPYSVRLYSSYQLPYPLSFCLRHSESVQRNCLAIPRFACQVLLKATAVATEIRNHA